MQESCSGNYQPLFEHQEDDPAALENDPVIVELREALRRVKEQLVEGGPKVQYEFIVAYIDEALKPEDHEKVQRLITRYRSWNSAWLEVLCCDEE